MSFPVHVTALTGTATLIVKVREHSTGDFLDFADGTFKAAGHTTPSIALSEPDATEFSGLFETAAIDPSLWSDGLYVAHVTDTAGDIEYNPIELEVRDGRLHTGEQLTVCGIVALESSSGDVTINAWLMFDGRLYGSPDSLSVTVFDDAGGSVAGPLVDAAADSNGVFKVVAAAAGLTVDTLYYAIASITADGVTYKAPVAFVVY
jgi:hypothetical protein